MTAPTAPNVPPPPQPQPRQTTPVPNTVTRHAPRRDESLMDRVRNVSWKVWVSVSVVVLLLSAGIWWYTNQSSSSATATPRVNVTSVAPPIAASGSNVVPGVNKPITTWFVTENNPQTQGRQTLFTKPTSMTQLVGNPPWAWMIWPLFLVAIYLLLRRNRMVASEQTDVKLFNVGLAVLIGAIVLARPLAVFTTDIMSFVVGEATLVTPEWVVALALFINLALQLGAALSGKLDWSPLSIGLYTSGLVFCWVWPEEAARWIIGLILMIAGFCLQIYETKRQNGGNKALFVAASMVIIVIVLKTTLSYLIAISLPLIPQPEDPTIALALGSILSIIYKGRLVLSVAVGTFAALGVGELAASWLIGMANQVVQLEGQNQVRADMNSSREDAVILGLMVVQLWWALLGF